HVEAYGGHCQQSWPARCDADTGHLLDCLRRSAGVVLGGRAAGRLVARGAAYSPCQRSRLDDVAVDWRRRGASCQCQPGHRLAAPPCPARAQWPGVGRDYPGRFWHWGGEKLCGVEGTERIWMDRPGARWSAGVALSQPAPLQSGAEGTVGPPGGWTERTSRAFQGLW